MSALVRMHQRAPRLFNTAAGALAFLILVPIMVRVVVSSRIFIQPDDLATAQAVLVPGASIVRGEPSAMLAQRMDAAIALYRGHKVKKILVSGDNGESDYDEVTVMLQYLREHGVPDRDIFLDRAGFDTYSTMYRARHVFAANHLIIVTQDFHLPRAVFLARAMGMDAQGLVAGYGGSGWDYLREIPATIKALLDVALHRQPKYLGAPVPLVGKGNTDVAAR